MKSTTLKVPRLTHYVDEDAYQAALAAAPEDERQWVSRDEYRIMFKPEHGADDDLRRAILEARREAAQLTAHADALAAYQLQRQRD